MGDCDDGFDIGPEEIALLGPSRRVGSGGKGTAVYPA